jgi:Transglycosylase SLT domain
LKRPTARGCAGALAAVVVVAAALSFPGGNLGESPVVPRIETFISSACGGPVPCPSPERLKWLGVLDKLLAERMPSLPKEDRTRLADVIYDEAKDASVDPLLVLAVIAVESGFDHGAESDAGAVGLMQLQPSTLRREAERSGLDADDPDDPVLNVRAGVRYFRRLLRSFGSTDVALMAYNAGPNRILRYLEEEGAIPDRFFVYPKRVQQELRRLKRARAGAHAAAPELTFADRDRPRPAVKVAQAAPLSSHAVAPAAPASEVAAR